MKSNKHLEILLASQSPRRRGLIQELGLPFRIVENEVDESYPSSLAGKEIAVYLAKKKSEGYTNPLEKRQVLLTSDTIVWHREMALNKPSDEREAVEMLSSLSGNTHEVITGVCLRTAEKTLVFSDTTKVVFKSLLEVDINHYVEHFKPLDKAGAYGIQEWIGLIGVERIEGSYHNVVGLPTQKIYDALQNL